MAQSAVNRPESKGRLDIISVRSPHAGNQHEILHIVSIAEKFHGESAYKNLPFSREKVERLVRSLAGQENGYVRVAEVDGAIEGGMICMAFAPPYSDALIVQDIGLYVSPSRRGSKIAALLVEDLIAWAKTLGVTELWLGVTSGIADEAAGRLYEGFGFHNQGSLYRKVL